MSLVLRGVGPSLARGAILRGRLVLRRVQGGDLLFQLTSEHIFRNGNRRRWRVWLDLRIAVFWLLGGLLVVLAASTTLPDGETLRALGQVRSRPRRRSSLICINERYVGSVGATVT